MQKLPIAAVIATRHDGGENFPQVIAAVVSGNRDQITGRRGKCPIDMFIRRSERMPMPMQIY